MLFIFIIYFFIKEFYSYFLYILFNLLIKLDNILNYFNNVIIFKKQIFNLFIKFIYLYFFLFIWYIYCYIISSILIQIYFLLNFEFRKCLILFRELVILFFFIFSIGFFKSFFLFNWFLIFSFLQFYRLESDKNLYFFEIINIFFYRIVLKYKNKTYIFFNTIVNDKKQEFLKTKLKYFWFFIFDLFSLVLFLFFVYYIFIKYYIYIYIIKIFIQILFYFYY